MSALDEIVAVRVNGEQSLRRVLSDASRTGQLDFLNGAVRNAVMLQEAAARGIDLR